VEPEALEDDEIVRRVRGGERGLFAVLMRRHNRRIYRAVRSVIRNEAEVEEVMQQAYLNAYAHLDQFAGDAQLSTWLVRIALNEALGHRRKARPLLSLDDPNISLENTMSATPSTESAPPNPEAHAEMRELAALLEVAIEGLPELYRTTFMLREVEGLTTSETAAAEGTNENVVKQRLHRARALIKERLTTEVGAVLPTTFSFDARRCDRVVAAVLAAIA